MSGPEQRPRLSSWQAIRRTIQRPIIALRRIHARRQEAEIFPWIEHVTAALAILGAILAFAIGRVFHLGTQSLEIGAILGAITGALLALKLTARPQGRATPSRSD